MPPARRCATCWARPAPSRPISRCSCSASPPSPSCCRSPPGAGGCSPTARSTGCAGALPAWLFGVIAAAAFASCLARTAQWPLPTGLGGVIGDAVCCAPSHPSSGGPLFGTGRTVVSASFSAIGLRAARHRLRVRLPAAPTRRDAPPGRRRGGDEAARSRSAGLVHYLPQLQGAGLQTRSRTPFGAAFRSTLSRRPARPKRRARRAALRRGERAAADPEPDEDAEAEEDEEAEASTKVTRTAQEEAGDKPAPKSASKSADGYELPPLNLLAAPKSTDRLRAEQRGAPGEPQARSSTCSAISACAARSSMRGRARW